MLHERYYTIRECRTTCHVTKVTMLKWIHDLGYKSPPRRKRGQKLLVPEHVLQRILENHSVMPGRTSYRKVARTRPSARKMAAAEAAEWYLR